MSEFHKMDQLVSFQEPILTQDGSAGASTSWSAKEAVPAAVRALRGRERTHADVLGAQGGYQLTVYTAVLEALGVRETWRAHWVDRGRTMQIRFVEDNGHRPLYTRIECEAGVAT